MFLSFVYIICLPVDLDISSVKIIVNSYTGETLQMGAKVSPANHYELCFMELPEAAGIVFNCVYLQNLY